MDNYAYYADTVKEEFVKKLCPKEYKEFRDFVVETSSLRDFADNYQYKYSKNDCDFNEEDFNKANELFIKLSEAFNKATIVEGEGLYLGLVYHEANDRGDELNGVGWTVDGHRTYTPTGEKFKDEIKRLTWTYFG